VKRFLLDRRRWLVLAALLVATGLGLWAWLAHEFDRLQAQELDRLTMQTKVVEVNLQRQIGAIGMSLTVLKKEYLDGGVIGAEGLDDQVSRQMQSLATSLPAVRAYLATDARGVVVLSSRPELVGFDAHGRDYFLTPKRSACADVLYVSHPHQSSLDGTTLTNLTRVLLDGSGAFAGVVSAAVDPAEFDILLNSVRYADDMQMVLAQDGGAVLAVQPEVQPMAGATLASLTPFHSAVAPADAVLTSLRGERLAVLRTMAAFAQALDKPLQVVAVRQHDAVFVLWQRDVINAALLYLLLVVLGVAGLRLFEQQRAQKIVAAKRLKLATEASGVGIWEFDLVSKHYYWDDAMFRIFGLHPQKASERNDDWQKLLSAKDLKRMRDATRLTIRQGHVFDLVFNMTRPDGQVRAMRNRAALYADEKGVPRRLIGATEDVTERRQQEADLRVAAVAFESTDSMFVANARCEILRVNYAFTALFGYAAQEAIGQTPNLLKSERHDSAFFADMWSQLQRYKRWQGELWNRCRDGHEVPCALSVTAVCDDDDQVTHYVATYTDITLRKAAEDEVKRLAFYDPLTQLPNRRLLSERLQQAISLAHRTRSQLALMYVDLDKFKPVNDQYGHAVGDALLRLVAQRLQSCLRESDTVARVGGDEFVVLLIDVKETQDALRVAEKMHEELRQPFPLPGGVALKISSCIGIALYPLHGMDETELAHRADVAMYYAKAAGRDRFMCFQSDMEQASDAAPVSAPPP